MRTFWHWKLGRGVVGFVRQGRFVSRGLGLRRHVYRDRIVVWLGCIKCLDRARQGITARVRTEGRAEVCRDRTGATRGEGRVLQGSFARRGRLCHNRVHEARFLDSRGTGTCQTVWHALVDSIVQQRT